MIITAAAEADRQGGLEGAGVDGAVALDERPRLVVEHHGAERQRPSRLLDLPVVPLLLQLEERELAFELVTEPTALLTTTE